MVRCANCLRKFRRKEVEDIFDGFLTVNFYDSQNHIAAQYVLADDGKIASIVVEDPYKRRGLGETMLQEAEKRGAHYAHAATPEGAALLAHHGWIRGRMTRFGRTYYKRGG